MRLSTKDVLEKIRRSSAFRSYQDAFEKATTLPLVLRHKESWGLPLIERPCAHPFCRALAADGRSCRKCLELQQELCARRPTGPLSLTCFAGITESVVPVNYGGAVVGYLQTGLVRISPADGKNLRSLKGQLAASGAPPLDASAEQAWRAVPVLPTEHYHAMIALLEHFAAQLEALSNHIVIEEEHAEAPLAHRARQYIEATFTEDLSLSRIAFHLHISTFHLCKVFKKAAGVTVREYLARVRVKQAMEELLNPHLRISEVAFAVGFRSLSQFNRDFKQIAGRSPTAYRRRLRRSLAA